MALCLSQQREADASLVYLDKARSILQKLVDEHPAQIDYQKDLAEIVNRLGYVDFTRGRYPDALKHYKAFQELCQKILDEVKDGPKPLRIMDMLARSYLNIASMHRTKAEAALALDASKKAVEQWSTLRELAPSVTSYRRDLGMAYHSKAWAEHQLGNDAEALVSAGHALAIFERLNKEHPHHLDYQEQQAALLNFEGFVYYEAGKLDDALKKFDRVVEIQKSIFQDSKGIDSRKLELSVGLQNLAETLVNRGDVEKGLSRFREAIELRRQLSADHPNDRGFALGLFDASLNFGDTLRHTGDPNQAGKSYDLAKSTLEPLLKSHPEDGELQCRRVRVLERTANALADGDQSDKALDLLRQAIELGRAVQKANAQAAEPAQVLSEALWNRARLLRSQGHAEEAGRLEKDLDDLWKGRPIAELMDLAKTQAARALEIGSGKTPLSKSAEKVREANFAQAASSLKLALSHGFRDVSPLRNKPEFAPLLERPEIKEAIAKLPGQATSKTP